MDGRCAALIYYRWARSRYLKPQRTMRVAVRGMMPRNIVTKDSLSRLKIYRGSEHKHAAQKPEAWTAE